MLTVLLWKIQKTYVQIKKQMLKGGISVPRNKALMKLLNMIGIGERAGSGVTDIYSVGGNQGFTVH